MEESIKVPFPSIAPIETFYLHRYKYKFTFPFNLLFLLQFHQHLRKDSFEISSVFVLYAYDSSICTFYIFLQFHCHFIRKGNTAMFSFASFYIFFCFHTFCMHRRRIAIVFTHDLLHQFPALRYAMVVAELSRYTSFISSLPVLFILSIRLCFYPPDGTSEPKAS